MLDIIQVILPIFTVIAIGAVLKKRSVLNDNFVATGNTLLMSIFLPVLLFYKISQSDFFQIFSLQHVLVMTVSIVLTFLISFPVGKMLHLPSSLIGTFVSSNFRTNAVFVGLPVSFFIFGDSGLTAASILVAFIVPINNILGVLAFSASGLKKTSIAGAAKKTVLNPLVISASAGILFSLSGWTLPVFVDTTFSILSGITLPLALMGIGATMKLENIKGHTFLLAVCSLFKLVFLPLVALLLFQLLPDPEFGLMEKVVIVLLAAPSAQINFVFASTMNGDAKLASGAIVTSTALSAISLVIWLKILETGFLTI